jgi:hypothetical protein
MNGHSFKVQCDFFFSFHGITFNAVFNFTAVHVHIHGMLSTLHMPHSSFTVFKTVKYFLMIAMMLIAIWGHTFLVTASKLMLTLQRWVKKKMKMMKKVPQAIFLLYRFMMMK